MYYTYALLLFFSWPSSSVDIKEEISTIHSQAKKQYNTNTDSTFALLQLAIIKSKEANYTVGEAKSYFLLGNIADREGDTDQAITSFLKYI